MRGDEAEHPCEPQRHSDAWAGSGPDLALQLLRRIREIQALLYCKVINLIIKVSWV